MRIAVLIVAAGRGRRFGEGTPKQYMPIVGICALRRCLDVFLGFEDVTLVQPVIHLDDTPLFAEAVTGIGDDRLLTPVMGGETRVQSVGRGLDALAQHAPDIVLVHDGARPFVTKTIIRDVITALDQAQAACVGLPVVDALWRAEDGMAITSMPRNGLWRAQTPQGFRFDTLVKAHAAYQGDAADDVEIVRAMGVEVQLVQGDAANFKITTPGDLARAQAFIAR